MKEPVDDGTQTNVSVFKFPPIIHVQSCKTNSNLSSLTHYVDIFVKVFITKSYDPTTHFETTCLDVLDVYKRITGADFDFSQVKHTLEDDQM